MKCEECKGTGKYVGFTKEEPCRSCNGTGYITTTPTDTPQCINVGVSVDRFGKPIVYSSGEAVNDIAVNYFTGLARYIALMGFNSKSFWSGVFPGFIINSGIERLRTMEDQLVNLKRKLVGLTLQEATDELKVQPESLDEVQIHQIRPVAIDGEPLSCTQDVRADRVNVAVNDGVITKVLNVG